MLFKLSYLIKSFALFGCIFVANTCLASTTNLEHNSEISANSASSMSEFSELNDFNDLDNFQVKNKNNTNIKKPSFIPADKAFIPQIIVNKDNSIDVSFFIAPKCYLYKERFSVKINSNAYSIAQTKIPEGEYHDDEYMGPSHIFKDTVSLKVYLDKIQNNLQGNFQDNISTSKNQINEIEVVYQGCTEGVCYPPITKVFSVNDFVFNNELNLSNSSTKLNNQENIKEEANTTNSNDESNAESIYNKIKNSNILFGLGIFFCFGVLLSMTPCMFPMYPIWSAIILGNKQKNFKTSLIYSFTYTQGIAITYMLAGFAIAYAGATFHATLQQPPFLISISVIFIILALSMFGAFTIALPSTITNKFQNYSDKLNGGSIIGVFLMGAISAIVASPCTTAPLAGALMFIVQDGSIIKGGIYLYVLSLGIGTPLFIIGLVGQKYLPKNGNWMIKVKALFGFMLLGTPLLLLESYIPNNILYLLISILVLSMIIYFTYDYLKKRPIIYASIIIILLALSTFVNVYYWENKLDTIENNNENNKVYLSNMDDAKKIVNADDLVLIDVRADWCRECIHMEKTTFITKEVLAELKNFNVAVIDISTITDDKQAIISNYNIQGVPSLLFFKNGRLVKKTDGYVSAEDFMNIANSLK